ncbi:Cytidylate kinase Cmk [Methanonatronarchaeum thermophilum]|uniref:Cytidylate kinase n=1 Tax=Methanonatronarchaeum thermophilum TaxID=1927129 RepID=A0A1Y3GBH9_9EURY|nr:AAA family ATPase [Methanonatronarchaeum thermophilum]OUJ18821.1 Cytidylate kinase Cmk [Methanonatronarchaeum thermophilum]
MIVAVSGPAGAGTSTTSRAVAKKAKLNHICAGQIFREMATDNKMTLERFSEYAEQNPEIDHKIDQKQKEIAENKNNILLEGRLAGWMAENADIKIWLKAPLKLRAKRVAKRENIQLKQALHEVKEREKSEKTRYQEYYQIDIDDLTIYDLIIDTANWNKQSVINIIDTAINNYNEETG